MLTSYGNITFEYNHNKQRVKKTTGSKVYTYTYDGNLLIKEQITDTTNDIDVTLEYIYDESQQLVGVVEGNNVYYYDKDATGEIIGIVDTYKDYVVKYTYTAYGEVTKQIIKQRNVSTYNSFLYKGYYYDVETELYWVSSRYYSLELCRWISPDSIEYLDPESINGLNLYCYCRNNPLKCKQTTFSFGVSFPNSTIFRTIYGEFIPIPSVTVYSLRMFNQTLKGSFRKGLLFGNGSIVGFYADWNARAQISLKKCTVKVGITGKFSVLNVSGQVGFGIDDLNISLKAAGDALTVSGMTGIFIDPKNNNYFIGAEAKATALSGRVGGQLDIYGLQIEAGISGELGSIGGKIGIGLKTNNDGTKEFYYGTGFAYGVGWDFYIRIRFDELF